MTWLTDAIERRAKQSIDDFLDSDKFTAKIESVVRRELKKPEYAPFVFVKHIQAELMRVDKTLKPNVAIKIAARAYREYLKDEGIKFGDPDYSWDEEGAVALAHAYEIDHWESAS